MRASPGVQLVVDFAVRARRVGRNAKRAPAAAVMLAVTLSAAPLIGCGGSKARSSTASSSPTTTPSTATSSPSTATTPTTITTATTPATTTPTTTAVPPSREVAPGVVTASASGVTATMHASSHHPVVNKLWPVSFTVSSAGKPARAEVRYEYLFAGQVVAHRSKYRFTGSFHDTFNWPSSAVGYPLTFRAVISSGATTLNLDYAIQVVS